MCIAFAIRPTGASSPLSRELFSRTVQAHPSRCKISSTMALSTYPAEFFAGRALTCQVGYCSVLMPFDPKMGEIF